MTRVSQLLLAAVLSITGLAASAQVTSANLVPAPDHWTTNGQSVVQSYAINQALALSGSDVRINGFDYGYQYNLGNSWTQCTWVNNGVCVQTQTFSPRVDVGISIRDNNSAQIYGTTHTETGVNTGNRSRDFQYRFTDPRDILTLGNFNYTASTSNNATVFGMYSRANYTVVTTTTPRFGDDSYVHVPLQFGFPFYGRTFTNSWMHSNGVVSFLDPSSAIDGAGYNPGAWAYCCSGERPSIHTPQFSYMIAPLWTDLYPVGQSRFRTEGTAQYQRYYWENIGEISNTNNLNTFGLELRPSGSIGALYSNVNIRNQNTWIGTIGNPRLGEWNEIQYGSVINSTNRTDWSMPFTTAADCSNPLLNPNCPGYAQAYFDQQCSVNPFHSSQCPGYATAYYNQQCSINALYHSGCPNYAQTFFDQQCGLDPLYNSQCSGYAQAYFDQQCSADPLYNSQCSGYADAYYVQQCSADPLYDVGCTGYATAYFDQQCSADPLYDVGCTGYATAYFDQQCSANSLYDSQCPGYAQAYFDQQCSANSLYDTRCNGYANAYYTQQCSADPLYDSQCPGYATAYFDQQCSLSPLYNSQCPGYATAYYTQQCTADPLYDSQCPGYAETYAKKYILPGVGSNTAVEETTTVTAEVVNEPGTTVEKEVTPVAAPAATASPTDVTAPVQLAAAPAPVAAPAVESKKEAAPAAAPAASGSAAGPKTTRQALAERRLETARAAAAAAAAEKAKSGEMSSQMDSAASLEQQVELQNVVLGAMGFVAGFDAYGRATVPDAPGYKPVDLYPGQRNIDTPASRRLLSGSDRLHQDMVDSQYNK